MGTTTAAEVVERIRKRQGARIRKFRLLRGLTTIQLAEIVGVTPAAVNQWEGGTFTPRQGKQLAIAEALDVPWSAVFGIDAETAA